MILFLAPSGSTLLPVLLALPQAAPPGAPPPAAAWQIVDVAAESGIDFHHSFGDDQFSKILEDTGSGVALIDCDGDGLLDLFLSSGQWVPGLSDPAFRERTSSARSRLYRNLGGMKWQEVTDAVGITERGFGMGAAVGDWDGDGDEDLYVLNWGPNVLYRNDGGRFTDVTAAAGVAGPEQLHGQRKWSVNGLFFDADRDGDLDLYVTNYLAFDPAYKDPALPKEYPYEGPDSYRGQQSILYRNRGDGTFVNATQEAGLAFPDGKSMGAVAADFDGDGDLDLFEAMDTTPNVLWRNDGGRFAEVGMVAGVALDKHGQPMASMHGTVGDFDGDQRPDLFVPDLAAGCLYRNTIAPGFVTDGASTAIGSGTPKLEFDEEGAQRGVGPVLQGSGAWGSQFDDFDLDGDLDLLVVLGGAFDLNAGEHDRLFQNDGTGRFADISERLGPAFQVRRVSRGAAFGDLDNDGDIDYVVNVKDVGARPRVLRNDLQRGADGPHWVTVKLVGAGRNRDAVGATVALSAGGVTRLRAVNRANSYLSQCDPRVHFGLGADRKVDRLEVTWPSGTRQWVAVSAIDRQIVVTETAAAPPNAK